jgi:DNA-directed RNA polymerase specialized sigma24 family protein
MQQTMFLEEGLGRRPRGDGQTLNTGHHTAASAGTCELVARASTGDQVAWDQLVERYGGMVWAVARARGLDPADAGAVSQVTWLLLVQHLGSLPQPERPGMWLLRTASREADRMRRLRGCDVANADEEQPGDHDASTLMATRTSTWPLALSGL